MPRRRNRVYSLETLERRDCPAGFTLTPLNQVVSEGNSADFELTLDAVSQVPESVIVTSESGTAIIGSDFMQRTERITFFPGETTKTFSVQTLRDPVESIEGAENFTVIVKPIGGIPSEITSFVVINDYVPPLNFQIDFVFGSDTPESLVTAAGLAANLWQSVIIGNLPEVDSPIFGTIDDIQINVQLGLLSGDSDGDGNTLAQGQPLLFRTDSLGLPYLAQIGVDEADISNPELSTIVAHEIGHCLGFPNSRSWEANVTPNTTSPTHFTGTNAVQQYNLLFGIAADAAGVPIEQDGGEGTAFAHWDDATFGNELMTGELDLTSTNPLSVITVGAFDDMGYDVNYDAAQPYTPPTTTVTTIGAGISNTIGSGISNAMATPPRGIPPRPTPPRRRVLPARITFPDKSSIILSEDNSSRQMLRTALQTNVGISNLNTPFTLHHLSTNQRAILAAWASLGQETGISLSSNLTSVVSGPKLSLFANEIFDFSAYGDAA
ncbi:MAG: leishmanolysin-related zinc metalloendopeptidase [Pirellulales bacterium]|jgi:hypothetical protein